MLDFISKGTRVLDRYCILEKIASGGLSVVYRGEDERLPREVCIKVFHALRKFNPSNVDDNIYRVSYRSFINEAFSLSRLTHPNTLRIYDFGYLTDPQRPNQKIPLQVSEYMTGGTLSQMIRQQGTLPLPKMRQILRALCGALAEAHQHGIIHRDIKPPNILFFSSETEKVPKLADFGIAKTGHFYSGPHGDGATSSQGGDEASMLMYSINWAAPEQIQGRAVQPATDLYSLGLVAINMLTAKVLFRSSNRDHALNQRMSSDALIDHLFHSLTIPPGLLAFFKRVCSPRIEGRPTDVESFLLELDRALDRAEARPLTDPSAQLRSMVLEPIHEAETDLHSRGLAGQHSAVPFGLDQQINGRQFSFVDLEKASLDLVIGERAHIRIALLPDTHGRFCLHLKGLNCFVRLEDGPPSSAVQIKQPARLFLVTAGRETLAEGFVQFGQGDPAQQVFYLDTLALAIENSERRWLVALDFGQQEAVRLLFGAPEGSVQLQSKGIT